MTARSRARAHERLAELIVVLAGAGPQTARLAIEAAIGRNGDAGDNLINVADAIVTLRSHESQDNDPVAAR